MRVHKKKNTQGVQLDIKQNIVLVTDDSHFTETKSLTPIANKEEKEKRK